MKVTTKDIIKILPIEAVLKMQLLNEFDVMDPDRKDELIEIVWDSYIAIFQLKLEENIRLALARAEKNQEDLDKDFYKRIREQTERELLSEDTEKATTVNLQHARDELQKLLDRPSSN